MFHDPLRSRIGEFLLSLGLAAVLTGCGGGGAVEAATLPPPTPTPTPTPPPTPTPDPLQAELLRLTAQANAAPMQPAPVQNPELVVLGQALFFDRILSGNRNISCYTCHDVDAASGDGLSVSIGEGGFGKATERQLADGLLIPRNAPPMLRLAGKRSLFWDGRVSQRQNGDLVTPEPALNGPAPAAAAIVAQLPTALAAQAMFPVTSSEEMRGLPGENELADATTNLEVWSRIMVRLVGTDDGTAAGIAEYRDLFSRAYPSVRRWSDFNFGHAAQAIAAFEIAAFATQGAAFDAWLVGNATALTDEQKRGGILFYGRGGCARCHGGAALTDGQDHAIGIPQIGPGKDFPIEDTGRALVTGDPRDRYRFRTPSLRNVELTGPYMHDGAYTSLEAAIRHYIAPEASLRTYDPSQLTPLLQSFVDTDVVRIDARARAISPLVRDGVRLNATEVGQLVAFLRTLTDTTALDLSAAEPERVPSGLPIDD